MNYFLYVKLKYKNYLKFIFKVIIVTIRPNTELLLSHNIISPRPCFPILSWQFVIIQFNKTSNSSHRIMDPVLAFTRDDTVYFYQVFFSLCYIQILIKRITSIFTQIFRLILMTRIVSVVVIYKK